MAAEVLAAAGIAVQVFDRRRSLGRKLLLAGRGGLNLTHSEPAADFRARYGRAADRMGPWLERFGPDDLRRWSGGLGQTTFVGSSGRVFPEAFRATPLLRAWLGRLTAMGVEFRAQHRWSGWSSDAPSELRFDGPHGQVTTRPDVTVLALGGASRPNVGGDGDWVRHLEAAGVEIAPLEPSNCGVRIQWTHEFAQRFAGEPLKNVTVHAADRSSRGDCVVTTAGLEGGPIYAASAAIRDGTHMVTIDLRPDLSAARLAEKLSARTKGMSTSKWLRRSGLQPPELGLLREAVGPSLPQDPEEIARLVKAVPLPVLGLASLEEAISTAGGVRLAEVDDHLMLRRLPGTFVAGEMLDWDAPTGGYLLQACFTTGLVAAQGALRWLSSTP